VAPGASLQLRRSLARAQLLQVVPLLQVPWQQSEAQRFVFPTVPPPGTHAAQVLLAVLQNAVDPPQSPSVLQPQPPATVAMHAVLEVFAAQLTLLPPEAHALDPLQICAGVKVAPLHEAPAHCVRLVPKHWTQVLLLVSHAGVVPLQAPSAVQPPQVSDPRQILLAAVHKAKLVEVHWTHCSLVVLQAGVVPVHAPGLAAVHWTQVLVLVSHAGVPPPQAASAVQPPQVCDVVLQTWLAAVHKAKLEPVHWTQVAVAVLQAGVVPLHCALPTHWTQLVAVRPLPLQTSPPEQGWFALLLPEATSLHVPGVVAQVLHVPVHALLQQKPSTQKVLRQVPVPESVAVHAWPLVDLQWPEPSHAWVVPAHELPFEPEATGEHVPRWPDRLQAWQVPHVVAVLQQTPSTQFPLRQEVPAEQLCPRVDRQLPLPSHAWVEPAHPLPFVLAATSVQVPWWPEMLQAWQVGHAEPEEPQQKPSTQWVLWHWSSAVHAVPLVSVGVQTPLAQYLFDPHWLSWVQAAQVRPVPPSAAVVQKPLSQSVATRHFLVFAHAGQAVKVPASGPPEGSV
jgi:hypothetical protein